MFVKDDITAPRAESKPHLNHAERFQALFVGLDRAYGQTWANAKPDPETGKVEARCLVVHDRPTALNWQKHLDGLIGFGAFALTDQNTCRWGAIDVDVYKGFDHLALLELCRELGLPLTMCRTKSGGWHLYLFLSEFLPASLVRKKLRNWAAALGHPTAEVFPKHDVMEVNVGNYLNAPYFGKWSLRYAIGSDGASLDVAEFLDHAERTRVTIAQLEAWPTLAPMPAKADPSVTAIDEDFAGYEGTGLEDVGDDELWCEGKGDDYWRELAHGLGSGKRHNGLKALAGLLFGRLEPNLAEVLVRLFAENQCDPPLRGRELTDIIRWTLKRELGR